MRIEVPAMAGVRTALLGARRTCLSLCLIHGFELASRDVGVQRRYGIGVWVGASLD